MTFNFGHIAHALGKEGSEMDRIIFMNFDDFISINSALLEKTGLSLYRSDSYDHPFVKVANVDRSTWVDSGMRALCLLIGKSKDEDQILGDRQFDVKRDRRVGFVDVAYGGEDENAIGASHYGADTSETSKLVNSELNKLLKKYAHKGVFDVAGNPVKNYYWTDGALESGKNWHRFLGHGVRKPRNVNPGYRPMLD
ncbi:hypothetical protein ACFWP0_29515 [Achromobacter sp. NPDC058515]|uniref:hypothetical protein n=1 Tax=Achromobacter sp. NPDC058515 TaxID=3346533 RepID=UPI0036464A5E